MKLYSWNRKIWSFEHARILDVEIKINSFLKHLLISMISRDISLIFEWCMKKKPIFIPIKIWSKIWPIDRDISDLARRAGGADILEVVYILLIEWHFGN